jgi:hypothetical protein
MPAQVVPFEDEKVVVLCGRVQAKADPESAADSRYPYYMGVELELENLRGGDGEKPLIGWDIHNDESLRNGIEYVTRKPFAGKEMLAAIESFYQQGFKYTGGPRTSTHIHVNAGDLSISNVRTMFVVSFMLEDAMFRVLEAKRKFCGYCMPLTEMSPQRIRNFLATDNMDSFARALSGPNAEKYYGFNAVSIRKHGTIEFRYFPGAPVKEELLSWMDYCTAIKRIGLKYSLDDLANLPDAYALAAWLEENLGQWGTRFLNAVGQQSLYNTLIEVLACVPAGGDMVARRDELVFVSKPLVQYIRDSYCIGEEQSNWLIPRLEKLRVMTADEWYGLLNESEMFVKLDAMKKRDAERMAARAAPLEEDLVVRFNPEWAEAPIPPPQDPQPADQDAFNLAAIAAQVQEADYRRRQADEMRRAREMMMRAAPVRPARPAPPVRGPLPRNPTPRVRG